MLSPANAFVWTDACQHAFDSAKLLLSSAPVLAAPDFTRSFELEVDASALGMELFLFKKMMLVLSIPFVTFLENSIDISEIIPP